MKEIEKLVREEGRDGEVHGGVRAGRERLVGCELPGGPEAITQGKTLEEARENLKDAIHLVLEVRREDAEKELQGREVIREPIEV